MQIRRLVMLFPSDVHSHSEANILLVLLQLMSTISFIECQSASRVGADKTLTLAKQRSLRPCHHRVDDDF